MNSTSTEHLDLVKAITTEFQLLPNYNLEAWGLPKYEHDGDSGFDLHAAISEPIVVHPHVPTMIPTGLKFNLVKGTEIQVRPRSGLSLKKGISVANTPGTVDSIYKGEVCAILINLTENSYEVQPGDRVAQAVLCPVYVARFVQVEDVGNSSRGEGGFGSTGKS